MFFLDPMQYTSGFKGIAGGIASYIQVKKLMDTLHSAYRTLITNCRNTKEISKTMFQLCDIDEGVRELDFDYKINKKIESGIPPKFHYYNNVSEIPELINNINKPLHNEKVRGEDIQILSMGNKFIPEVQKANKYFNIFTSENGVYTNPRISNMNQYKSRRDRIIIHFLELNTSGVTPQGFRNKGMMKIPHVFPENNSEIVKEIKAAIKRKSETGMTAAEISSHGLVNSSEDYLFYMYLSKEQTLDICNKVNTLEEKNYKISIAELAKDEDKFYKSEIFHHFNIENPEVVSFHEKFYTTTKKGERIVDVEQIELMFNLSNWYREFSKEKRFFIPSDAKIEKHELNVLTNLSGHSYTGREIKEQIEDESGDLVNGSFTLKSKIQGFVNFCKNNIDFKAKSAKHSSVHKFRGMDQKYVTLVGFNQISNYTIQALYIGMSRAKVKLDIIAHISLAQKIERKLSETND